MNTTFIVTFAALFWICFSIFLLRKRTVWLIFMFSFFNSTVTACFLSDIVAYAAVFVISFAVMGIAALAALLLSSLTRRKNLAGKM